MSKKINEEGNVYGHLTVLHQVPRTRRQQGRHTMWLCRCTCGNKKEVPGSALRQGMDDKPGSKPYSRISRINESTFLSADLHRNMLNSNLSISLS